ncbi:MAG: hypothetical protein IKA46_04195 [Clostridia bacterium]|nr:hypothetical protein [Clostridia bacterium]
MKIPKFLKTITALFVCIAFIRAINNAGGISIYNILLKIQSINFDISSIEDIIDFFENSSFESGFREWNNELTGFDGFVTNLKNILSSFFTMIGNLIKVFVVGLWKIFVEIFKLLGKLLDLVLYVTGFKS